MLAYYKFEALINFSSLLLAIPSVPFLCLVLIELKRNDGLRLRVSIQCEPRVLLVKAKILSRSHCAAKFSVHLRKVD